MQYSIICVGKLKEKYYADAVREYSKRLSRYGNINIIEVPDEKTPDKASEATEAQIKKKEAERIQKNIKESMYVIALDLKGKEYDSVDFSKHLEQLKSNGKSHIAFIIGGSLGLYEPLLQQTDERICFSKMTFPHQLMRVILLEQVYRANRIQNGEPYHK